MKENNTKENEYLSDDSQGYGSFDKDLITTVEVESVDTERLVTID